MSVSLRGTPTTGSVGAAGTLTVGVPAGTSAGDVLAYSIAVNSPSNVPATPSGLTLLDSDATGPSVAVYYRICNGSEPASYSWTVASPAAGTGRAYSGVDNSSPINAHSLNRTVGSVTSTATSITTTVANTKLVFGAVIATQDTSFGTPSGFGNQAFTNNTGVAAASLDATQAAAGATGAISANWSPATGNNYASLIALAPAPTASAFTNSFEGGTDGVTLTQGSGGNTGGASGTFFDQVSIASGAVAQFSSAAAFSGLLGFRTASRATAGNAYAQWGTSYPAITDDYGRFFLRIGAIPPTNGRIISWYEDSLVNNCFLQLNNTGTLSIKTGSTVIATSSTALTPGQWYRIETHAHASTTAMTIEVRIYATPTSSSFTESFGSTSSFAGLANIGAIIVGLQGVAANWPSSTTFVDYDEVVFGASTWVGPIGGTGRGITPAGISAASSVSGSVAEKHKLVPAAIAATSSVSGNLGSPPTSGGTAPGATYGQSTYGVATYGSPITTPTPPPPSGGGGGGGTPAPPPPPSGGSGSVTPGQPSIIPPITPTGDAIVDFIESSPPGLFPENDDSNFGFIIRNLWASKIEELIGQQDLIYKERFVDSSEVFLDEWERETGTPAFPAGFDLVTRRAIVLGRIRKGPFTRSMRKEIIERYLKATFGGGVSFSTAGIPIGSGIVLTGGSTAPDVSSVYKIVENVAGFSYTVYILNTYTPAAGMTRELTRVTPAHISFTVSFVASLP